VRRLSFVLLTIQAIALVFPTFLCAVFLLAGVAPVWSDALLRGEGFGLAVWTAFLFGLASAWWLLLAYFYGGRRAARHAPAVVWIVAALIAMVSVAGFSVRADSSPLQGFAPGVLFVPTFLHLLIEVWLVRPDDMQETRVDSQSELFCSESCASAMRVRSFGQCPECGKIWDGKTQGTESHYRNNAWKLCVTCSRRQHRCVNCGSDIGRAPWSSSKPGV
jgi:hypothetical protein